MCDLTKLRQDVEAAVQKKMDACEPFTTADISHPLIKSDKTVRHYEVRKIINEMDARGEMEVADFDTTIITVYPQVGKTTMARLWHPVGYDINKYKGGHKVLIRSDNYKSSTTPISTPSTGALRLVAPSKGNILVTQNCSRQSKRQTLNIPRNIIKEAGWKPGDSLDVLVSVSMGITPPTKIDISPTTGKGKQRVDKEGRVRLHGLNATPIGGLSNVAVVDVQGTNHIQLS